MIFLAACFRVQQDIFEKVLLRVNCGLPFENRFGFVRILVLCNHYIFFPADKHVGVYELVCTQKLVIKTGFISPENLRWNIYKVLQFKAPAIVTDAARELLKQYQVVEVDLAASNFWASTLASRDRLTLMNGDSFRVAFEQAYGYRANSDALRGYLAARVIARVVRNSSGHPRFSPGKLKLSVEQALQTAPW